MSLSFPYAALSEPSPILLDDSLWPLVMVRFGRSGTQEDLERYLAQRRAYLERQQPHLCLIDTRQLHLPSPRLRQRYIDWMCEHELQLRQWTLGTACLIVSPVVKMMMSVIRHAASMNTPFFVTPSLAPAVTWAAERLQDAGQHQAATRIRSHYGIPAS